MRFERAFVASLLVLGLTGPALAADVTLTGGLIRTSASDGGNVEDETYLPKPVPFADTLDAQNGSTRSVASYVVNDERIAISLLQVRSGNATAGAFTQNTILFQVSEPVPYSLEGRFDTVDPDGRRIELVVVLVNYMDMVTLFSNEQISSATPNESFTVGLEGGDSFNTVSGSLTGTLQPGKTYHLYYNLIYYDAPNSPNSGGTGSGFLALHFGPVPGAGLVDWRPVNGAGNLDDTTGFGGVASPFRIAAKEVTNADYVAFLNSVAASDPHEVYNPFMTSIAEGGITRSGGDGSYTYAAKPGQENEPVNYVSFWDAARFANWVENGQPIDPQGPGTTETGAYTLDPALEAACESSPANCEAANQIRRNPGASVVLPTRDEWDEVYYDPVDDVYFDYPTASNTAPACNVPANDNGNTANCAAFPNWLDEPATGFGLRTHPQPLGRLRHGGQRERMDRDLVRCLPRPARRILWILRVGHGCHEQRRRLPRF